MKRRPFRTGLVAGLVALTLAGAACGSGSSSSSAQKPATAAGAVATTAPTTPETSAPAPVETPAPAATPTTAKPAAPQPAAPIGTPLPEAGNQHRCRSCASVRIAVEWGRYGYYFKCGDCQGNTPIREVCPSCGQKEKLRKSGPQFFAECGACTTSRVYYVNASEIGLKRVS